MVAFLKKVKYSRERRVVGIGQCDRPFCSMCDRTPSSDRANPE
ncbi:hypothetical protein Q5692_35100 [Microcoleus sp. C2C3]